MEDEYFTVPLEDVKREIRKGIIECRKRGLIHSAKWLAEMNFGLVEVDCVDNNAEHGNGFNNSTYLEGIFPNEYDAYFLAKCYFDVREYDRAAHLVRNCESPVPRFLHFYATYMGKEKRKLDSTTDQTNLNESGYVKDLADLLAILRAEHGRRRLDGYGLYLYGIVLKSLNLNQAAEQILYQAIRMEPMLWGAYIELAPLITDKEKLQNMEFGGHWMRNFFIAHTYIEMYLNDEGIKAYEWLQSAGFKKCVYVTSQMALAYHNKRDVDKAVEMFQALQEDDPYRLDNMDTYSNLLFVKEMKTEMAQLAQKAVSINKYRPETCCVIGNFYSIRCEHQMAILYFQRALKLNPKYLAAWTLMGHEFMELKNTNAAIQSYRKAVEVNKRDYRAWYGLGQAYEILKMHYYSLYYFKIAHQLRPYDSRMLVALGETYEKLDKNDNAIKCYWKACDVGDIEGIAMYKLANLHEKLGEDEEAVHCYMIYCEDEGAATDKQSLFHGYMTLANYYETKGEYDRASYYAYKCLESDDRKSEAKSLLKTIENKRTGKVSDSNSIPSSVVTAIPNTCNADTSSEDDMVMELSDINRTSELQHTSRRLPRPTNSLAHLLMPLASTSAGASTSSDSIAGGSTSISGGANGSGASTSTHHLRRRTTNNTTNTNTNIVSAREGILSTNTSLTPTENLANLVQTTPSAGILVANNEDDDTDTDAQSMEVSTISID